MTTPARDLTLYYVDTEQTITADGLHPMVYPTPTGAADLPDLVARIGERAAQDAVIVVGPDLARQIGLPATAPASRKWPRKMAMPREHKGWRVPAAAWPCTQWYRRDDQGAQHDVWVWIQPWAAHHQDAADMFATDHTGDGWPIVTRLLRYRELVGGPFVMNPGVSGLHLLQTVYAPRGRKPYWSPDPANGPGPDASERAWGHWDRPRNAGPGIPGWEYAYDLNVAYLAAMNTVEVAADPLHRLKGPQDFDARRAGWWRVRRHPWNGPLPDPIGPVGAGQDADPVRPGDTEYRWVTTPTARLLQIMTERGMYGGVDVIDSWTAPKVRLFRKFAEGLGTARIACMASTDPDDFWDDEKTPKRGPVAQAVKNTFAHAYGMMRTPGRRIYRPDWSAAIVAHNRFTLYLKLLARYDQTGQAPYQIQTDCVWYFDATRPDLDDAGVPVRPHLPVGPALGQCKPPTITRREPTA